MSAGTLAGIEALAEGFRGAVMLDENFDVVEVSDGVVDTGGYSREELIGRSAFDMLHPDDLARAGQAMAELARVQVPTTDGIYRMKFADEHYEDFAVQAFTVERNGAVHTVFCFSDVSDVLRVEEFTRDAVEAMRELSGSRRLDDLLERVHKLSQRHVRGTRLTISTIRNGVTRTHDRLPDGSFTVVTAERPVPHHVERALEHHRQGPWRAYNRMALFEVRDSGSRVTSVLTGPDDELLGYVEAHRDSSDEPGDREWMMHGLVRQVLDAGLQRLLLDEQLTFAADHDPLTGLINRRRLFNDMAAHRDLAGTTLLLIDLDGFAWINNNLGHHAGDEALMALTERLRELYPDHASIARFGGDEFVVWSPRPLADPEALAISLRSRPIRPSSSEDRRAALRCSIGSITIRPGESAGDAIRRADEAMYVAKRNGGDQVQAA